MEKDKAVIGYYEQDGDEYICFPYWSAPWIDNGEALLDIIRVAREMEDIDFWRIVSFLLIGYLTEDIQGYNHILSEVEQAFEMVE